MSKKGQMPSHVGLAQKWKLRQKLIEAYRKGDSKAVKNIELQIENLK